MKLVIISDTHGKHAALKVPKGDILIHAGDITNYGYESEVMDFLSWFQKQPHKHKIFIAGNHDFYLEKERQEKIKAIIPEDIIYLNDSGVTVDGLKIWGSPITPWYYNWAFNRHRGKPIAKHWKLIPDDTNILITHGPVFGILDEDANEKHVGCKDLLETVEKINPAVHICGHIHEAYGSRVKLPTRFINASVLNEDNNLQNRPVVLEV